MDERYSNTVALTIASQGTTATPSQVRVRLMQLGNTLPDHLAVRARICNSGTFAASTNATIAPVSGKGTTVTTHTSGKDLVIRTAQSATATGVLTISGVVVQGEAITLGSKSYKFNAGGLTAAQLSGFTEIDIEDDTTKAQGTLTIAEDVTVGDTFQVGNKTYVVVANGTADTDGEVSEGANEAAFKVNFVAAINGTDDVNTANTLVTAAAFVGDDCVLTAKTGGVAGNSIVTAEVGQGFTHASNVFDDTTLGTTTAGVDCTAADAVTAVAAALSGTATGADGAGNTVDVTAATAGTAGNITSTETMANGAFGAATLTGGVDELPGEVWIAVTDAQAETVTLRVGPADVGGVAANYTPALNVTHAAP